MATAEQRAYNKVIEGLFYFQANACINVDPATWGKLIDAVLVAKKEIDEKVEADKEHVYE